jgi:hypothetical protein
MFLCVAQYASLHIRAWAWLRLPLVAHGRPVEGGSALQNPQTIVDLKHLNQLHLLRKTTQPVSSIMPLTLEHLSLRDAGSSCCRSVALWAPMQYTNLHIICC